MEAMAACLLLLTGTAWGDWQRVGEDNLGVVYADTDVVKNGNIAKMWSLLDYKDYQRMVEVGYFSQKAQVEYDCAERKSRGLSVALHADHMGAGKIIYTDESPREWEPVPADPVQQNLWKAACK
jgi:hypothetical protein